MGVAVSAGLGELEFERLLNQADIALYDAKKKGRNRIEPTGLKIGSAAH
jgi:PleD family two-component response regulator